MLNQSVLVVESDFQMQLSPAGSLQTKNNEKLSGIAKAINEQIAKEDRDACLYGLLYTQSSFGR